MQISSHARDFMIDFFGEGLPFVEGTQTGFDVAYFHADLKGSNRYSHYRSGVALHKYPIRPLCSSCLP